MHAIDSCLIFSAARRGADVGIAALGLILALTVATTTALIAPASAVDTTNSVQLPLQLAQKQRMTLKRCCGQ